jgi:hypothetical protein
VPATLTYDRAQNIVFMSFPEPEELSDRAAIAAHFRRVCDFWRANAGGKKSYFLVNLENITIDAVQLAFYVEETRKAHDLCALVSVRFGGNSLQRTVTRLAGMKIHRPSNIYETKEEALEVVARLRRGEIEARTNES